ncbi:MAG: hypothetical protein AAB451_03315 [Patescibacteria group bacterium]
MKIELVGLGWERDGENTDKVYERLKEKIALLIKKEDPPLLGVAKNINLSTCVQLDKLHSVVEGELLLKNY